MNDIRLTKEELKRNYLYLKFEGICGIGTSGNTDADYIMQIGREKLLEFKYVQAIIFDFTDLKYEFGNRFIKLFEPNIYRNNSMTPISIISSQDSLKNWKTLYEYSGLKFDFYGTEKSVFQDDIPNAIQSINKRLNENKNNA